MSNLLFDRILSKPNQSFFLLGPRGSGKSTWIRKHFTSAKTFDLLDESLYQSLLADISIFSNSLRDLPEETWVVVDEIQRLPQLLNEVHRFIENRSLRFVLCGSSARKLKKAGTNLLAGRALKKTMHPLVPEELKKEFDLESALTYGTLPIISQSKSRKASLSAYVELYLKEEIQAEAIVRNLPGFARFLPIAALFHAQTLNTSSLSRDAGVSRSTVNNYLEILKDTLMIFRLHPFESRLRVREKKHSKLYWIDSGLVRAIKKQFSTVAAEERGSLFEGWVANFLRIYKKERDLFDAFWYWSPAETKQTEVDFLLQKNNMFIAIEVKSQNKTSPEDFKGLRAIKDLENLKKRVLVYTGTHKQRTPDGIEILPISDLINQVETNTLW